MLFKDVIESDLTVYGLPVFFQVDSIDVDLWKVCKEATGQSVSRSRICKSKDEISLKEDLILLIFL